MASTITVDKKAIMDLVRLKNKFDSVIESLELMGDKEFMDSYKKSQRANKEKRVC